MKLFNKLSLTLAIVASSMGMLSGSAGAAGNATFSLASVGSSYMAGTNISVAINENSAAEAVNSVQADLTYDQSALQYTGFGAGSAFSCPVVSGGSGSLSIGCLVPGGTVSSSQYIGTVNFKVLASSGSSTVNMAQSSIIGRSDATDIWNHANVGFGYTFTPATGGRGGSTPAAAPRVLAAETEEEAAPAPAPEAAPVAAPVIKPVVKPTETVKPVVKKSHMGQTIFSIIVLLLVIAGIAALSNREKVAKMFNDMKKKLNGASSAKVAAPAAAAAAATKSTAKKKAPAKKKAAAKKTSSKK